VKEIQRDGLVEKKTVLWQQPTLNWMEYL